MFFEEFTVGNICRLLSPDVMVYVRNLPDNALIWNGYSTEGFDKEMPVKAVELVDIDIVRLYVRR